MYTRKDYELAHQEYFQATYDLTKARDLAQLNKLMSQEWRTIDFIYHDMSLAQRLSREGDDESVDWLIKHFHPNLNPVVNETARRGLHERTNSLLTKGAELKYALSGYAAVGNVERVESLLGRLRYSPILNAVAAGFAENNDHEQVERYLQRGATVTEVVTGYARARNHVYVEHYILNGGDIGDAVLGYAMTGQLEKLYEMLDRYDGENTGLLHVFALTGLVVSGHFEEAKQYADNYNRYDLMFAGSAYATAGDICQATFRMLGQAPTPAMVSGYSNNGCFLHPDRLLQLLCWVENAELRIIIAEEYQKETSSSQEEVDDIVSHASRLRKINEKFAMPYYEARHLSEKEQTWLIEKGEAAYVWLSQGERALKDLGLPAEMFVKISSYVLGVSDSAALSSVQQSRERLQFHTEQAINLSYKENMFARLFGCCLGYEKQRKKLLSDLVEVTDHRYN